MYHEMTKTNGQKKVVVFKTTTSKPRANPCSLNWLRALAEHHPEIQSPSNGGVQSGIYWPHHKPHIALSICRMIKKLRPQ